MTNGIVGTEECTLKRNEATDKFYELLVQSPRVGIPLYVMEQGATVAQSGEELLRAEGTTLTAVKLENLGQLAVFGHVQVTTQSLQSLAGRGIPVTYQTREGRIYGMFIGFDENPIAVRLRQHQAISDGASGSASRGAS